MQNGTGKYFSVLLLMLYFYYSIGIPFLHRHDTVAITTTSATGAMALIKQFPSSLQEKAIADATVSKQCSICDDYCVFFVDNHLSVALQVPLMPAIKHPHQVYSSITAIVSGASNKGPPAAAII